ncbi:MAG: leucine-rich repeat protein, partial [Odoribacteraceae bacterium]|nr:leucine-rich repeat protein [Odoribacteraceae bacterium]
MKSTNTTNNSRDARRSRRVDPSPSTGRERRAPRHRSGKRSRFFITRRGAVALLAAALSFSSCSREFAREKAGDDGMMFVTLSFTMPSPPATRALTDAIEGQVNRVDVLLFKGGDLYYRAGVSNASITPDATTPDTKKSFTVRLPAGDNYEAVLLANAENALSGIAPSVILAPGDSRAAILDALVQELTVTTNKWTDDFPLIPAWGYVTDLDVSAGVTVPVISLTRAIARVDVSVIDDAAVRDRFELTRVYLYNYSRAGTLAPATAVSPNAIDGYDKTQWDGDKAIAPHLPSIIPPLKVQGPLEYIVDDGQKHAFKQEIYTFEAAAAILPPAAGWEENTCLVIGGKYNGGQESYYRVDFASGTGPYAPLALLRGHLYDVVIQDVNDHGWSSPGLAHANLPSNIIVKINAWREEFTNVVYNGQNYLSVDKDRVTLYKDGNETSITVVTDHGGWEIDIPAGNEWITVNPTACTTDETPRTITIGATAWQEPGDTPSRAGHFYIVAGNLEKMITVEQINADELAFLSITDFETGEPLNELLFAAGNALASPAARKFRVQWQPASLPVNVARVDFSGALPFAHETASGQDDLSASSYAGGDVVFTVQPPVSFVPSARFTRLDFSVNSGANRVELPLYLWQDAATYAFSDDGKTLTLFANFDRGTTLETLEDATTIPELADNSKAAAVTTLVIEGDAPALADNQVRGIKNRITLLTGLANVSLPDFTGMIPTGAFSGVSATEPNAWLQGFTAPLASGVGESAFSYCESLARINVSSATSIGHGAFWGCNGLTTVNVSAAISLGNAAFQECANLTAVDLSSAEIIGEYAFFYCKKLATAILRSPVKTFKEGAFFECHVLDVEVIVAESIGKHAFYGAPKVRKVTGLSSFTGIIG